MLACYRVGHVVEFCALLLNMVGCLVHGKLWSAMLMFVKDELCIGGNRLMCIPGKMVG